jgi:hypothetical protein
MADVMYYLDGGPKTASEILAQSTKIVDEKKAAQAQVVSDTLNQKSIEVRTGIVSSSSTSTAKGRAKTAAYIASQKERDAKAARDILNEVPPQVQAGIPIEPKPPVTVEQLGIKDNVQVITNKPTEVKPDYTIQPTVTQQIYKDITQNIPATYEEKIKPKISSAIEKSLEVIGYTGGYQQQVTLPSRQTGTISTIQPYSNRVTDVKLDLSNVRQQSTPIINAQLPQVGNNIMVTAIPTRKEVAQATPNILQFGVESATLMNPIVATTFGEYQILQSSKNLVYANNPEERNAALLGVGVGALFTLGGAKEFLTKPIVTKLEPLLPEAKVAVEQIPLKAGEKELNLFKYKTTQEVPGRGVILTNKLRQGLGIKPIVEGQIEKNQLYFVSTVGSRSVEGMGDKYVLAGEPYVITSGRKGAKYLTVSTVKDVGQRVPIPSLSKLPKSQQYLVEETVSKGLADGRPIKLKAIPSLLQEDAQLTRGVNIASKKVRVSSLPDNDVLFSRVPGKKVPTVTTVGSITTPIQTEQEGFKLYKITSGAKQISTSPLKSRASGNVLPAKGILKRYNPIDVEFNLDNYEFQKSVVLFQGTTEKNAKNILDQGFKSGKELGGGQGIAGDLGEIFATPNKQRAEGYANRAALKQNMINPEKTTPAIVKIQLSKGEFGDIINKQGGQLGRYEEVILKDIPKERISLVNPKQESAIELPTMITPSTRRSPLPKNVRLALSQDKGYSNAINALEVSGAVATSSSLSVGKQTSLAGLSPQKSSSLSNQVINSEYNPSRLTQTDFTTNTSSSTELQVTSSIVTGRTGSSFVDRTDQTQKMVNLEIFNTAQSPTQIQVPKEVQITAPATRQTQIQKQTQLQVPRQSQIQVSRSPQIQTPTIRPRITPRLNPKSKNEILASAISKVRKAFDVYKYKKGKAVKIASRLPEGLAKEFGVKTNLGDISASFKLVESGTTSREDINFKIPGNLFQPSKRDRTRFVQRLGTRLSARGEVRDIMAAKRRTPKMTRFLSPSAILK